MNTMLDEMKKILQKKYQNLYECFNEVLQFILTQEEGKQLSYFTLLLRDIEFDELPIEDLESFLNEETLARITDDIESLCRRILENLVKENVTEEEFYKKLWEKLLDKTLLPDVNAQTAFLMCLWLDPWLPYYHLEVGSRMDEEIFKHTLDKIRPQLKKAFFIMAVPFEQKTQRASLLMLLADELEGDEKTVFWAVVISQLMKKAHVPEMEQATGKAKDMTI